jgi:hypothetical protein
MLLKTVDVNMGSTLAFNDLPTHIKFTLTFENARPLGGSEIFNRLNCGRCRSYVKVNVQQENIDSEIPSDTDQNLVTSTFEEFPYNSEGKSGKGGDHSDTLYSKLKVGDTAKQYDWYEFNKTQEEEQLDEYRQAFFDSFEQQPPSNKDAGDKAAAATGKGGNNKTRPKSSNPKRKAPVKKNKK